MKKSLLFIFLSVILLNMAAVGAQAAGQTCQAKVAGSFYPADKITLQAQVKKYLKNAPAPKVKGEVRAIIVPHAGYAYSGPVAASAYRAVENKPFTRVILIGSSHRIDSQKIALPAYDYFETPLGKIEVDREFVNELIKSSRRLNLDNRPFDAEDNALEVQLPFLQTTLKNFKIVPIFFGDISFINCRTLAFALSGLVDESTLIVASTDWSHYYPYDIAAKKDLRALNHVVSGDVEHFLQEISSGEVELCGPPSVITTMILAPTLGANKVVLLKYATSGDETGDVLKVVGYAAVAYYQQENAVSSSGKKELLKIARVTLESKLSGKQRPDFKIEDDALKEKSGVFVTLKKDGELRGCIGLLQPITPLYLGVVEMAVEAATGDSRFSPVTKDELKNIKIEISVLSPMKKVKDPAEIVVGKDGLYIVRGWCAGLLLPQVPVEWGWSREQFLREVCLKAGLPAKAWQDKNAVLYKFTAEVFHE